MLLDYKVLREAHTDVYKRDRSGSRDEKCRCDEIYDPYAVSSRTRGQVHYVYLSMQYLAFFYSCKIDNFPIKHCYVLAQR